MHELLNAPSLGEIKPSKFLNEARRAIKVEDMSYAVLCEILEVQTALSIVFKCPMDEFARCADRAMIRCSGQFSNSSNMQIQRLERQVEQFKPQYKIKLQEIQNYFTKIFPHRFLFDNLNRLSGVAIPHGIVFPQTSVITINVLGKMLVNVFTLVNGIRESRRSLC